MKKSAIIFVSFFLISLSLATAEPQSLYSQFNGKVVKVYLGEIKNSSEETSISTDVLRQKLAEALKNRRSVTFEMTDKPENADLSIDVNVRAFMWTDHDPVDMLVGVGAVALDAATIEDYARAEAYVVVSSAKSQKALWQDSVVSTITKKPMSKADSIPLVTDELAKNFVKQCFKKSR